jgi:acid phosphatase type 7
MASPGVLNLPGGVSAISYYSFDIGLVHFVALSTEAYLSNTEKEQHEWLLADLAAVNRTSTPWIVAYGHGSVYSSVDSTKDSDLAASLIRNGPLGLEDTFMRFGVDLWINGHQVR